VTFTTAGSAALTTVAMGSAAPFSASPLGEVSVEPGE